MKDQKEVALSFVKANGPVLPVKISKAIDTNILMASAVLSELVSDKKVLLTHMNIGTSPLYYINGQEPKLQMLEKYISGKRKDAYFALKEGRVLRDDKLEPAIRVALRELKDFAKPLQVKVNGNQYLFWKWYLVGNDEVSQKIRSRFVVPKPAEKPVEQPVVQPKEPEVKKEEKPVTLDDRIEPKKIEVKEEVKEVEEKQEVVEEQTVQETISFYKAVDDYFKKNKINILKEEIVRKDREFNFIIEIPSELGNLKYFVKVKNKKKIGDGDLTSAYSQAHLESLPLLFLTNGELVKKTKDLLNTGLKGVVFKKF